MESPLSPIHKMVPHSITVPPPPAPDFSYQTNPALQSMIDAIVTPSAQPPSPSRPENPFYPIPPHDPQDVPMEEVIAPDITVRNQEEPTSEPGSPIISWAPTQEDDLFRTTLGTLRLQFPQMLDEMLS